MNSPTARQVEGVRLETLGGVRGLRTEEEPRVMGSYEGANAEGPGEEGEVSLGGGEDLLNLDKEGETQVDILTAGS